MAFPRGEQGSSGALLTAPTELLTSTTFLTSKDDLFTRRPTLRIHIDTLYTNYASIRCDINTDTMADDSKMQIMRQVQQEAAMQNARMLVEVLFFLQILLHNI